VFINPRLPGFKSETLGFIPALARMTWLKHLKLPATLDAPTDIDGQVPTSAAIVYVGRCDDKMVSIEQVRHCRPLCSRFGRDRSGVSR
jgi:hypothetical protein